MSDSCEIGDLPTFLKAIDEVYTNFAHQPWWRGHTNNLWSLVPGVHRVSAHGVGYEANIAKKFVQRAPTRHPKCPAAGQYARWLFLMQHYRLRTRLLDWTESPLIGLHFAVLLDEYQEAPGSLWALDPFLLNDVQVGVPGIAQPGEPHALELFKQAFGKKTDVFNFSNADAVIALVTEEVDVRMMVQLSGMTIHGSPLPLELRKDARRYVREFKVEPSAKAKLRSQLERLGIRERNLFPDLEHLAQDLNRDVYAIEMPVEPT